MSDLKALIFDLDGTLADTERDGHRVAFNRAFAEAGFDWEWTVDRYGELLEISGGQERVRHFIAQDVPEFDPPAVDRLAEELHEAKNRFYETEIASIPLRPGIRRLLEDGRSAGLQLAIATNSSATNVRSLLDTYDLDRYFAVICTGDEVLQKKPAPDLYELALARLDLSAEQALAFEDSDKGLEAALAADLPAVITVNGYTRHQDLAAAALVLDSLGDPDAPTTVLGGQLQDQFSAITQFEIAIARQIRKDYPGSNR